MNECNQPILQNLGLDQSCHRDKQHGPPHRDSNDESVRETYRGGHGCLRSPIPFCHRPIDLEGQLRCVHLGRMAPVEGPTYNSWNFTREDVPLRSPLSHEDILSSLHLRVKTVDFLTFSDFSNSILSTYWKVRCSKNIKTIESEFKYSHISSILPTNSEQCICDLS